MGFDPIEIEVDENLLPSGVSLSRLTNDVSLGSFDDGASTIEGYALLLAPAGMEKAEPEEVSAAFAIVGAKRQVHVYTIASSDSIRLVARRIVPAPGRVDPALRLARATFRFVDQAERLSAVALSRFEELAKAPGAYLETWDLYDAKSQEADETRKTDVGKISISSRTVEVKGEVWDVPRRVIERLNQGDRLEPWREESEQQVRQVGGAPGSDPVPVVEVVEKQADKGRLVVARVEESAMTTERDWMLSLRGNIKQHKRRSEARERIKQGRSANPMLGLIIEGEVPLARQSLRKAVAAISPLVQRKLFAEQKPIDAQVNAIKVALNTPDIAIIQGPPGTGKTTVIQAIYERLGEIASERGSAALPTLLTAPQHQAVLNMIERMDSRGLPIEKFGQQQPASSRIEESEEEGRLERWLTSYREKVRAAFPSFREHEWTERLSELLEGYQSKPSEQIARELLEEVWKAPQDLVDSETRLRAGRMADAIRRSEEVQADEFRSEAIRCLMSVRVTAEGFADDGVESVAALLASSEIAGRLTDEERRRLESLAPDSSTRETLEWLRRLRRRLATEFVPVFSGPANGVRPAVVDLVEQAISSARRSASTNGPEAALAHFVRQIEVDSELLVAAAREYATAVAATVQQSESSRVSPSAPSEADSLKPRFDTVIVDEAARATPGDLMIPMSFARERIILVGDHRQLPHMVEQHIIDKFEESADSIGYREALETSLFQHLKARAEKLTAVDGIPRVVTLNAQFRMHPDLGEFVSDTFYAPFGEGFGSPRPPEDFAHSLEPFVGSCLGWVDVAPQLGAEAQRGSTSWARIAEVNAISSLIRTWNLDEASKEMSVGVITFYSEQKNLISARIAGEALDPHRRLTVGTIDSFQGREFDAVILSAVRTSHSSGRRPQYGHLKSANRLCVAMSRQKRLLVVVGDRAHFRGEDARAAVPGLSSFLQLCEARDRVIEWHG
jgi:hypothetical protein